jgi:hypothetical protein
VDATRRHSELEATATRAPGLQIAPLNSQEFDRCERRRTDEQRDWGYPEGDTCRVQRRGRRGIIFLLERGEETLNESLQSANHGGRLGPTIARPGVLIGAAVAVMLVAAGCGGATSSSTTNANAVAVTPAGLRALGLSLNQPIYWVGPAAHVTYERTSTGDGRVLVRYLPRGAAVGTSDPHLTVGTYAVPNAYAAAQRAASRSGAVQIKVATSAIAFSTTSHPLNAWIAYPGSRYQIEVFDPTPGRARHLVASGKVVRVPGSPMETRPVAVSAKSLAKVATAAQRPIYWAGPQPNQTYELTRTSQGAFLLRYLEPGAALGAATPHLTVGTYPVKNALAAVRRLSLAKGASTINLAGGGLAVLNPHFPKSVYLAYPGSNYEVEVFDPSLAHARQLVTSGRILAVP